MYHLCGSYDSGSSYWWLESLSAESSTNRESADIMSCHLEAAFVKMAAFPMIPIALVFPILIKLLVSFICLWIISMSLLTHGIPDGII